MQLIWVPAIVTLAVTLLRLTGERLGWSTALFNPAPGGGAAIVGISWLVPIFGVYFAVKRAKQGDGPGNPWRALGVALLGFALALASAIAPNMLHFGLRRSIVTFAAGSVIAIFVGLKAWPALARTLVAYGFLARIPVALIALVAMYGNWGTHYDVAPPEGQYLNQFAPIVKWFWIGLLPQMTAWIMFTVIVGTIFGAIAVGIVRPRPAAAA